MKYDGKPEEIKNILPETVVERWMILSAAILVLGLLLLLIFLAYHLISKRKKNRRDSQLLPSAADGSVTQELPVAAVQASLRALRTLDDIVYCESGEIIP